MADVNKVHGPSGLPDSFGKKDKASVDADKFKEAMRKRVTEVSQVDPDEQKKRKRREEAEEDSLEEIVEGPATPASQITPFSLETGPKKASPSEMQKGGKGISPIESAQPTTPRTSTPSPFFQTPSTDEMADDSGTLEEEAFMENIPSSSESPSPPQALNPPQTPAPTIQAPLTPSPSPEMISSTTQPLIPEPAPVDQSESRQQSSEKNQTPPSIAPSEKKPPEPGLEPNLTNPLAKEQQRSEEPLKKIEPLSKKKGITSADIETTQPTKAEDTSTFFEQMGRENEKEEKPPTQPLEDSQIQGVGISQPFSPFLQELEGKEEKKIEKKQPSEIDTSTPMNLSPETSGTPVPLSPEPLPSYVNIHPQVMEMFDRMVGVMTVMSMSGMTETVITLNAPQFASSVFFGSQIIIQEFSTAPQAYNIQLNGTPQAVALFQGNANDLMAAFQAGNYNFRVNRLETGYLPERPLFKRKEKAGDNEEDTGENPQ